MRYITTLLIIVLVIVVSSMGMATEKEFTNSIGMKFILIPAGTFIMGSPSDDPERFKDEIHHQVTISRSFYIQTTEVTQRQWKQVMGSNPSYFKNGGDDCPVENVSWNDVQEFIKELNRQERTEKYRLPTEAEWEYAARAGTTTKYSFGNSEDNLEKYAWYDKNSGNQTHPVGQKRPNAWDLYDMHGNVWEWVQDWFGDYPSGHATDPTVPSPGSYRVVRGGSSGSFARSCRSVNRLCFSPNAKFYDLGFRLVRTP
jgi:formylglycine-generating enzyme required for sulfatase activity